MKIKNGKPLNKKSYVLAIAIVFLIVATFFLSQNNAKNISGQATRIADDPSPGNDIETSTFVLKKDGSVGIGMTTPHSRDKLVVRTGDDRLMSFGDQIGTPGATTLQEYNDARSANIPLEIRGNPTVFNIGSVGIGTNTPQAKLHVSSSGDSFAFGSGNVPYPSSQWSDTSGNIVGKGGTTDFRIHIQDGTGRVNYLWNAYTSLTEKSREPVDPSDPNQDKTYIAAVHKYIVSGEPATKLYQGQSGACNPADASCVPGIGSGFFEFLGAPTGTAGEEISWQSIASFGSGRENALEVNGKTKTTGLTVASSGITLYGDTSLNDGGSTTGTLTAYCMKLTRVASVGIIPVATLGACA